MFPIIILIIFIGMIAGAAVLVMSTMKKLNSTDGGAIASTKNINNAQAFLPFVDIKDDVIDLGGFKYRAIIECTSINYALKTEAEKNIIDQAFRNFLNGLQYPVSLYIQTKELNYSKILETLENDVEQTKIDCPRLANYAQIYYDEIFHLKETINNSKQKKKYIIVPYEEAVMMNELNAKEKEEYSKKELSSRISMLLDNITPMGIKGTRLNTGDIIELIYSVYHRDDDAIVDNIVSGDYMESIVSGSSAPQKQDALKKAIMILQEAESNLKFNIVNDKNPAGANSLFLAISKNIMELKNGLTNIENRGGITNLATDDELFEMLEGNGSDEMFGQAEQISVPISEFKSYYNSKGVHESDTYNQGGIE